MQTYKKIYTIFENIPLILIIICYFASNFKSHFVSPQVIYTLTSIGNEIPIHLWSLVSALQSICHLHDRQIIVPEYDRL